MARMRFQYKVSRTQLQTVQNKFKDLQKPLTKKQAKTAGRLIVDAIRKNLSRGASAIRGMGKMPAYRGQYRKRIRKYGQVNGYSKKLRPVNLKLSGKFWDALRSKVEMESTGAVVKVGFYDKKSKDMEKGHRQGWNGQAVRPIIPQKGERFAKPIEAAYLKVFNASVKKVSSGKR